MSEKRSKLDRRKDEVEYVQDLNRQNQELDHEKMKTEKEANEKRLAEGGYKKDAKICAIVGTAFSRHLAPYDNKNAEIWGVAHCLLLQDIPRLDKVFEIHLEKVWSIEKSPFSPREEPIILHANKEKACPWRKHEDISVIVGEENDKFNKQEILPRMELKKRFQHLLPEGDGFYCTNSIAWMIAYAISLNKFDEIHLYGIHLETDTEWAYERPCVEMWMGFFAGMQYQKGYKTRSIYVPEMAPMLKGSHEYGFAEIETKRKKLQGRIEFYAKALADTQRQHAMLVEKVGKLKKDLDTPTEEKVKMIKGQIDHMQKELDKYFKAEDKEKFDLELKENIEKGIKQTEADVQMMRDKINQLLGSKQAVEYELKDLNA